MKANYPLEIIFNAVCDYFQFSKEEILYKERTKNLVLARQIFCYISDEFSTSSQGKIGRFIGYTNGNVIYSINEIKIKKEIEKGVKKDVEGVISNLFQADSIVIHDIDLLKLTENYSKLFN